MTVENEDQASVGNDDAGDDEEVTSRECKNNINTDLSCKWFLFTVLFDCNRMY